jgi:tetratricopeptide (TPR) repeat protein
MALAAEGKSNDALRHYAKAVALKPEVDKSPILHHFLAESYAKAGQFRKAILSAEKALSLAHAAGEQQLAGQIRQRIEFYQQQAIRERMELYKQDKPTMVP